MLKYIYLTSCGYSGSTLLSFILGGHPKIATIGELANSIDDLDSENYKCSCNLLIKNCPFWNNVTKAMLLKGYTNFSYKKFGLRYPQKNASKIHKLQLLDLKNKFISDFRDHFLDLILGHNNKIEEIMTRNIDLAETITKLYKKDIFFDASKDPNRIRFLKKYLRCEFKIIHLIKDGRGFLSSAKHYNPEKSDADLISSWKKINNFAERSQKYVHKGDVLTLLYKDLANHPKRSIKNICDFIGVKFYDRCLNFRNFDHHIIGNSKMRFGLDTQIRYDEKWKNILSEEQLRLFNKKAGKQNHRYGY